MPFNLDVNVGPSNVNANWINWAEWEAPPPNSTPASNIGPGSICPWTTSSQWFSLHEVTRQRQFDHLDHSVERHL